MVYANNQYDKPSVYKPKDLVCLRSYSHQLDENPFYHVIRTVFSISLS